MPEPALPVSLYFMWQWWERHYQHAYGRPDRIDLDWLDATYLGRQRFLHEQFGAFGLGQARPELDPAFLSRVIVYNCLSVPAALGQRVVAKEIGGFDCIPLPAEQVRVLRPVDMADTPYGERVMAERDLRLGRYGVVTQLLDLGSAANNGFCLRGQAFYADLIADPGLARAYLDAITETMRLGYRFVTQCFGPIAGFPLGNCNAVMMSPRLYTTMLRPYDVAIVEAVAQMTGQPPRCDLHHCDVPVTGPRRYIDSPTYDFIDAYAALPGLRSLQASCLSDVADLRARLPGVAFSAMVNPVDLLKKSPEQVAADIERAVAAGAADLAVWNLDPEFGADRVTDLLQRIQAAAARHGRRAAFSAIPMTWEEIGWEFPRYQPQEA